ncbi:MAG: hypothetical protein V4576_00780 [Patescibacteria group bacterium]
MAELELGTNNTLPNQFRSRAILGELKHPKVLDLILKTGIVKTETAAVRLLLLSAGVIFAISIVVFVKTFSNTTPVSPVLEIDKINVPNN